MKKILIAMILIMSCSKPNNPPTPTPTPVPPTTVNHITISSNTLTLLPWETTQLSVIAFDNASNLITGKSATWSSSDESRLSVSSTGLVTANLLGSSTITATIDGVTSTITIKVDIPSSPYVSRNVMLDSLGDWSETYVTLNPKNPLNIVASANWATFTSFDGGRKWKYISANEVDPSVCFSYDGNVIRGGMTASPVSTNRVMSITRSTDGGLTFPTMKYAYNPTAPSLGSPDQTMLWIDNSPSSSFKGNVYMIASDYPSGSPAYVLKGFPFIFTKSSDGGNTWTPAIDISTCATCGQEANSQITTGINGEIYVAWMQGNNYVFNSSLDGGKTWGTDKIIYTNILRTNKYALTDDVRGNISIDVDRSSGANRGTIYLCSADVNNINGGACDGWVIRSLDGGNTWSKPVYLSDAPKGAYKYYFQPKISVAPNGRIDAVWYDTRNWVGSNINSVLYDVYYANSIDGGLTFSKNIRVTPNSVLKTTNCSDPQQNCGDRHLFEYLGITSDSTRALPVWTNYNYTQNKGKPTFATIWIK